MEAMQNPVASTSYSCSPLLSRPNSSRHARRSSAPSVADAHPTSIARTSVLKHRGGARPRLSCKASADGANAAAADPQPSPEQPPPPPPSLQEALDQVEKLLRTGNSEGEAKAVLLMRQLSSQGVVRAFGAGQQVPKRVYTLEELRLNKIEPAKYLSPEDNTLNGVRNLMQGSAAVGLAAAYFSGLLDLSQLGQVAILGFFLLTLDQVGAAGGFEALAIDTAGRLVSRTYARRVALHEAGHFLVAYLLGLLPRQYSLTALDAYRSSRQLNVQAGCQFCDSEFQSEVGSGKLSSSSLGTYACVALAGVATEYLRFGQAEGGRGDVMQLDALLRALQFSQAKADSEVRWAVLNTTSLLRRHAALHDRLADAMDRGASVAECCEIIERGVREEELAPGGPPPSVAAVATATQNPE